MPHPSWNDSYASGVPPWDTGQPEPLLVEFITSAGLAPVRALEIGAGTGTNTIWLAERGFDVLGVDVSPLAVEKAHAKMEGRELRCRFGTLDFLATPPPGGPFHFVFDRGCFHVFDEPEERSRFAECVAAALEPGGSHALGEARALLGFVEHMKAAAIEDEVERAAGRGRGEKVQCPEA